MLFTGRAISAREAVDVGLVNRLLPPGALEEATRELVSAIAANAPLTVRAAKAALRAAHLPGRRAVAEALTAACASSADAREGHRAFLEKRPPRFQGR
jgi:enoyl-CoA hydratase/carnithine racemase